MKFSTFMWPINYPSDGRCIYCLGDLSVLPRTDEHIIPRALNGASVLVGSACEQHARFSNSEYEDHVLNNELVAIRALLDLKRRNRGKNKRPLKLPLAAINPPPDVLETRSAYVTILAADEFPPLFHITLHSPPLLLAPHIPSSVKMWSRNLLDVIPAGRRPGHVAIETITHTGKLHMMFLKIGYCYAVSQLGLDGFDGTRTREMLLGGLHDNAPVFDYVGTARDEWAGHHKPAAKDLHTLELEREGSHLIAKVRLFAGLGMPTVEVVVGEIATQPKIPLK